MKWEKICSINQNKMSAGWSLVETSFMRDSSRIIRKMVMEYKNGPMETGTKDTGQTTMLPGEGTFYHANKDIYHGNFIRDQAYGEGTLLKANGSKYVGSWRENHPWGKGLYQWVNGSSYEGDFVAGEKHGLGKFKWENRSFYEGKWFH